MDGFAAIGVRSTLPKLIALRLANVGAVAYKSEQRVVTLSVAEERLEPHRVLTGVVAVSGASVAIVRKVAR